MIYELLKEARDALEYEADNYEGYAGAFDKVYSLIAKIDAALAKPMEPVAWVDAFDLHSVKNCGQYSVLLRSDVRNFAEVPLYTYPLMWELSDEEIEAVCSGLVKTTPGQVPSTMQMIRACIKAAERKV
jgi:hypothetical protein